MNEMDELVAYPDDGPTLPTFDRLVESAMNDLQQRPHVLYQLWIEECYKRAGLNRDEWNRMPKAQQLQIMQNHVPNPQSSNVHHRTVRIVTQGRSTTRACG